MKQEARPNTVASRKDRRFQDAARAVESAVARFKRQCPHQDARELRAEAWIAAIEAMRTWKPEVADFYAYAGRATFMALAKFTLKMGQPLSAPDSGGRSDPNGEMVVVAATGKQVAKKTGGRWGLDTANTTFVDAYKNPKRVAQHGSESADLRWRTRLEARLLALVGPDEEAFERMLVGQAPPATKAKAALATAMTNLTERIRDDRELRDIWNEREDAEST